MAKFHEMMKDILWDVEKFLHESLQEVTLPSLAATQRSSILDKIALLQKEYPQLQSNKLGSPLAEPSSPPPYLDMKGGTTAKHTNSTEYIFSDCADDHYEVCEKETSETAIENSFENSYSANDQEESPYDGSEKIIPICASELSSASKTGYLEKKRKGLFNPYQKRWCAVREGVLFYYSRPTDKRQCGQIKLPGYDIRPVISRDGSKKELSFELICPGKRSYQFAASTTKEMQEWIAAIEKASVARCGSVISSVGIADTCAVTPTISVHIPEEDIYEMIEDHSQANSANNSNRGVSSNSMQEYDDGQDLYDDADSFLPAVLEAQNAFVELEIENPEEWYISQWDCNADETNELSFMRGDLLHVINKEHDSHSWWVCEMKGVSGLVPKSYLTPAYELVGERSI